MLEVHLTPFFHKDKTSILIRTVVGFGDEDISETEIFGLMEISGYNLSVFAGGSAVPGDWGFFGLHESSREGPSRVGTERARPNPYTRAAGPGPTIEAQEQPNTERSSQSRRLVRGREKRPEGPTKERSGGDEIQEVAQ
ncbi:hypothetical protein B0H11DRAFT_1930885 [Mycena galericulata]|nr:hypothetical protein B0H11DRAFT_1930885 [Mycena galericulata]